MFTVVIAEQKHINSIEKYKLFLKPFADQQHMKIIRWNREGQTFWDCVPELEATIVHHKEWRAVVVCGQDALSQKNPFDFVECKLPPKPEYEGKDGADYENLREYYRTVREIKFKAYEEAVKHPLTRLMTYLCEQPLATGGLNHDLVERTETEKLLQQDFEGEDFTAQEKKIKARQLEYEEYIAEAEKKEKLRKGILGNDLCDIVYPCQVLCIALRTKSVQAHDLKEQWKPHVNHQYNRFYDWNLYFDKMRYLAFDILPKENKRYEVDYIRFLSAVLLLAGNELPPDGLRPNMVYTLLCHHNDKALEEILLEYDAKLTLTDELLERSISERQQAVEDKLSDSEAERLFCANVTVAVNTNPDFDRAELYATSDGIGLAFDCPDNEFGKWAHEYDDAKYALARFLKQPRRALQKSVDALRNLSVMETDQCKRLDGFQMEDIAEHISDEELAMIETPTRSIYDVERYYRQMDEVNQKVEAKLDKRMTKKRTLILGLSAATVFLLGFLPMLFGNIQSGDISAALALTLLSLAIFSAAAVICLLCLRWGLVKLIREFNRTMKDIENDIDAAMTQFSCYLSHVCNVMRGHSVLNYCAVADEPNLRAVRLIRKHQQDIRRQKAEIREVFSGVMPQFGKNPKLATQEPYNFDFTKMKDYVYPMPYREGLKCKVDFIQSGNMIETPVGFIDKIEVRLEELYD